MSTERFTRGAIFASRAVEIPLDDRLVVTGSISLMRSIHDDASAETLAIPKSRSDVTAVAAYFLTPSVALFGGTGRTICTMEMNGTSFMLSGGVSLTFAPRLAP